ncbi:hypothetical protein BofuT4_P065880.1 [Botrytis cinerea T4]|uniref:Uncharacterized protein n=1 Tax=Botryotinia fuckeliana (strain T4) TaxID=999810 RepID=G2XRR3_BOTF4|nr:hypothetical protein BofuT4_P065880.1 [Botrytis cinerea T4]
MSFGKVLDTLHHPSLDGKSNFVHGGKDRYVIGTTLIKHIIPLFLDVECPEWFWTTIWAGEASW